MKQFNFNISGIEELNSLLQSEKISTYYNFQSQLIQILSAKNEKEWFRLLGNTIRNVFPSAVIIGTSTVGEINEGKMLTDSTVIMFSFFESSSLNLFSYECKTGNDEAIGKLLIKDVEALNLDIKGMLLLSTPVSNDSAKLFNSIAVCNISYPIFGGGAGDYANERKTLVFDGKHCYEQGVIAVAFSGNNLNIEPLTYLGWYPISKEMTITEVDDMSVKTIDDQLAFSIYEKYLGINANDDFFMNVLEFPFLVYRNGQIVARVPFFVNEDGSIQFVADLQKGEKFRIGYGNPQTIIAESATIQNKMQNFQPDAIYLFTCICRRFLMQQDVELETMPFNCIAPTAGFYTYGEFLANNTFHSLLNSTMVAVGIREGAKGEKKEYRNLMPEEFKRSLDPYENQHTRILSRLLYFIDATTKELEEQNKALKLLNEQKNEFLGIAAHDLRSPIGVIQGFSQLLEDELGDDYKDYTSMIINESSKMLHLLNELLDISKIEAGKLDLKKSETDYISFIKRNIKMNELLAQNKKIRIVGDFETPSQTLSFDEGKIEQVLNNLISNAIKYSYPDSTITVKVFKGNHQIITQVVDEGQGISENEIDGIFKPFKKTSTKPTGGENSHGLGLAIVKKIIDGHEGSVGVSSELRKGSTFYFVLPV
ncbi:MAG TPA: FIST N-terminal domain-containing protein [Bacteroidales bacterium]|nr:FIST N-terminal domain-containing protein [Bacteroidales bacterium]